MSPGTSSADLRLLTPLVLMDALQDAGTVVCEPMHRLRLEFPVETLGSILSALARLGAVPGAPVARGASYVLEGDIPAGRVHELQQQLPGLSRGEGVCESAFDHYRPVSGTFPTRPRTGPDPLNRKEYRLYVRRRL